MEDDPDLIEGLSKALERAGATVTEKSSARGAHTGALNELKTNSSAYDLVILDIRLPEDDEKLNESHVLIRKYNEFAIQLRGHIASGDLVREDDIRDECESIRRRYLEVLDDSAALKMLQVIKDVGTKILTPVLFLTSRSDPSVRNDAVEIARELCHPNGVDHMVKPVLTEALLSKVAALLRPEESGAPCKT